MVKEVRIGWDEEFGQPPLNIPPQWDSDPDDLVDDLKRSRSDSRSKRSKVRRSNPMHQPPAE